MTWLGIVIAIVLIATVVAYARDALREPVPVPPAPPEAETAGYAVVLCHRRSAGVSRADLAAWGHERARLIRDRREAVGLSSYRQLHHVSRQNIVYILSWLSRTWPMTALSSFLHGLPLPGLSIYDSERDAEDWDVIEILGFADAEAVARFLSDAESCAALDEDAARVTRRRHAVPMQVVRALAGASAGGQQVHNVYCLRARPHLGRRGMLGYWVDRHRPYVLGLRPKLGFESYDQLVARGTEGLEDAAGALSHGAGAPWDGIAVLGYGDMPAVRRGLVDPRVPAANLGLVHDETRFLDHARSSLMLGRVRHRF